MTRRRQRRAKNVTECELSGGAKLNDLKTDIPILK